MKETTKLPTVLLKKVLHRNEVQLLLVFTYNNYLKEKIKNTGGYNWSQTLKAWYIGYTAENIARIKEVLKNDVNFKLDASIYHTIEVKPTRKLRVISEENKEIIRLYVKYLKGKCYSESTVKTYFTFVADFIDYIADKPLAELNNRDVEQCIELCMQYNPQELVMKQGEKNVLIVNAQGREVVPIVPNDNVVDTTSAGDAFNGVYIGARASGFAPKTAALAASAAASKVIETPGAIMPKELFDDFWKSYNL